MRRLSITFKDFERLDMRAAKLVAVESIPGMKKIMKAKVDLGDPRRCRILQAK
jgi:tRNA-binding EMAP/Myf-like protein